MKQFLGCNQTVTLVHHIRDGGADIYTCCPIHGVSWYEKMVVAVSDNGAKPVGVVKVRIPAASIPAQLPEKLDYIVKGEIPAVSRPADLAGQTYFQITAVSDNRRGKLPHVMVSGT